MVNIDPNLIKGIIFDYGGTIDSRGIHWSEIIWDGYRHCGTPVTKVQFREAYVHGERELAKTRHILPRHNFYDLLHIKMQVELQFLVEEGILNPLAVQQYSGPIAEYCYKAARDAVEEARPVLEALSKRYPMVLVSNFYGNIEAVLGDFDLRRYFKDIVESAVVGVRKPDPRIFLLGAEALQLRPQQVLVVGDSLKKDIIPAETAGFHTAWLKGKGWTEDEDRVTHPNTIKKLDELLTTLLYSFNQTRGNFLIN